MGHNGCLMFCQRTAGEERRVSRRVVWSDIQVGFPTVQASSSAQHPPNALKFPGTTVYDLTTRYKFMMDSAFPNKQKTTNITLIFYWLIRFSLSPSHPIFRGDPFPIHGDDCYLVSTSCPLTHVSSSVMIFLKKVLITICIGKQFLTDFNTVPFLFASQQTRHEFCTDADTSEVFFFQ